MLQVLLNTCLKWTSALLLRYAREINTNNYGSYCIKMVWNLDSPKLDVKTIKLITEVLCIVVGHSP